MKREFMHEDAVEIYKALRGLKVRSGEYRKGVFHLHTPASHDYRLFKDVSLSYHKECGTEQIFDKCCELYPPFSVAYKSYEEFARLPLPDMYTNRMEQLAYVCLAMKIINLNLDFVVVSDHNTILGCQKLEKAIDFCIGEQKSKHYPEVIYGVEISCADKMHVIIIFGKRNEKSKATLMSWLSNNLISESEGSFRTSFDTIEAFSDNDFISYIAHINTSSLFDDTFLSRGYKKKLLNLGNICKLGLKDMDKKEEITQRVNGIVPNRECLFILDNDAHCIDEIEDRVSFVMGHSIDFIALKAAFLDYDVCIKYNKPNIPCIWIHGIGIPYNSANFLCSRQENEENYFVLRFSPHMNCLIGGRGSGKSTIINMISLLLGGQVTPDDSIEIICKHEYIYLMITKNEKEYFVVFTRPEKKYEGYTYIQNIRDYVKNDIRKNHEGKYFRYERVCKYLHANNVNIYEIVDVSKREWRIMNNTEKKDLLTSAFSDSYSINYILSMIAQDKISEFILDELCNKMKVRKEKNEPINRGIRPLRKYLQFVSKKINEKEILLGDIIEKYNSYRRQTLRIVRKNINNSSDYSRILVPSYNSAIKKEIRNYNIRIHDVSDYFQAVIIKLGILKVIEAIIDSNASYLISVEPLMHYCFDQDYKSINTDVSVINESNQEGILKRVLHGILADEISIEECIEQYYSQDYYLSLEFNLSSNTPDDTAKPLFRDITELSMGQKVVAILSFILSFSDFSDDNTPLIIDQPEDNLDGQYIYDNLVKDLRGIKGKRQVVIATHNSTLVTNCKAEQVIVMKSDNQHGWIERTGYPTNRRITESILRYLEGGKQSFRHRYYVYREHI